MSDDRNRERAAAKQSIRAGGNIQSKGGEGDKIPPGIDPALKAQPKKRPLGLMLGVMAAVAAVAVGATVLSSKMSEPVAGMGFVIIDDPKEVVEYIHSQNLPPATEERREEQAKHEELVVWKIKQLPGFSGQEGEVFTLDNGVDSHQYTIASGGQSFGIFAEKTTPSFKFSAGENPSHGAMTGTWTTPAGSTRYDMRTGETIDVRVK